MDECQSISIARLCDRKRPYRLRDVWQARLERVDRHVYERELGARARRNRIGVVVVRAIVMSVFVVVGASVFC